MLINCHRWNDEAKPRHGDVIFPNTELCKLATNTSTSLLVDSDSFLHLCNEWIDGPLQYVTMNGTTRMEERSNVCWILSRGHWRPRVVTTGFERPATQDWYFVRPPWIAFPNSTIWIISLLLFIFHKLLTNHLNDTKIWLNGKNYSLQQSTIYTWISENYGAIVHSFWCPTAKAVLCTYIGTTLGRSTIRR